MKRIVKIVLCLVATLSTIHLKLSADEVEDLRLAVNESNWTEGKSLGEALVESDPGNGETYYLLGKSYFGLEEFESAVGALKTANEIVTDNADYLADYGYALIMRGQEMNMFQAGPTYMRALDQYKAAVKVNPDHLGAHIGLARYYTNAPRIGGGSIAKAKEHAAEIARIEPYLGRVEYAFIALKEQRYADAEEQFSEAVALNDKEAWIHFELAKLQQQSGKMLEAKEGYEKTVALDPEHERANAALKAY